MKLWHSKLGWGLAISYAIVFSAAYVNFLDKNKSFWIADILLNVLAVPYVVVGRVVTQDATFQLHGNQPLGLALGLVFCAAFLYMLGYLIERLLRLPSA
jgi:hypothetical protein